MSSPSDEFYIGWQEKVPPSYAKPVRALVWLLALVVPITALIIVLNQQPFANSIFEFGNLTTLKGTLVIEPIPMLKVSQADGVKSVVLVGFGKFGAEQTLADIEEAQGLALAGKVVELRGTKIYHDGKMALELTEGSESFVGMGNQPSFRSQDPQSLGQVTLIGEILDPKCALGVMIPAEGKSHRSCAIRCISGGIPPLFRMTDAQGQSNYALMLGLDGQPINQELLPYVADQIRVCGRLEQQDDWLVVYLDPQDILRLLPYRASSNIPQCGS